MSQGNPINEIIGFATVSILTFMKFGIEVSKKRIHDRLNAEGVRQPVMSQRKKLEGTIVLLDRMEIVAYILAFTLTLCVLIIKLSNGQDTSQCIFFCGPPGFHTLP